MARTAAKAPKIGNTAGRPRGAAGIWLVGLICGALVALATPYAVVAGAFLAPGLLLIFLDTGSGRPVAGPVLMIGAATLVRPGMALWAAGHQMGSALSLVGDPRALAISWALQGLGWLVIELGPSLIRLVFDASAQTRALRLRHARAQIEAEWGIPPAAEPPQE
jgi:hypothetical protein